MLKTFFRLALRLYPPEYRRTFEAEMLDVLSQREAEARAGGGLRLLSFCVHETFGLITGAASDHGIPARSTELWLWSLEAPAMTVTFYALGVVAAHEFGLWGFFFPATYIVAIAVIAVGAWIVGRTCTLVRQRRRHYAVVATALVMSMLIIPGSLRLLEDARAAALLKRPDAEVTFAFPGLHVTSFRKAIDPPPTAGLTFSQVFKQGPTAMTLVHHRESTAPPYVALGALLAGSVAFVSRRRVSC